MLKPQNLVEMLANTVNRDPSKPALKWKENGTYRSINYQEMWSMIKTIALGMKKLGIKKDSKVAIISDNHPHWAISDFAVLSLGAVVVPIYPTSTNKQVAYILANAEIEMLLVQNARMLSRLSLIHNLPQHIILLEGDLGENQTALTFDSVIKMGQADIETDWNYSSVQLSDLATIVHTSGTTGNPKGVMLSHNNLYNNVEATITYVPFSPNDTFLSVLPLSHILERTAGHFTPLYYGATIAYAESIYTVTKNLNEVKPTVLISVPRMYEKIYNNITEFFARSIGLKKLIIDWALKVAKKKEEYTLLGYNWAVPRSIKLQYALAHYFVFARIHDQLGGRLRILGSGGAALEGKIVRFFNHIGLPLVEAYGLTECSPGITANHLANMQPGTIGKPIPGTEIKLLPDGELLVKSPSVMMGYYRQPEETNETLKDGWLHTGDIAKVDEYGYLHIIDRKKNIIVLSTGKNVAPQPIESKLATSAYIQQAVLIGNKHKYVTALIIPDYKMISEKAEQASQQSLLKSPKVISLIQSEIDRLLSEFSKYERPKKFRFLTQELSMEKGELTPTLKVKMTQVERNYQELIKEMYEDTYYEEVAAGQ